jgi:hypothetical protein
MEGSALGYGDELNAVVSFFAKHLASVLSVLTRFNSRLELLEIQSISDQQQPPCPSSPDEVNSNTARTEFPRYGLL